MAETGVDVGRDLSAVPHELHDGFEVLQACLRFGLPLRLYPRQVLHVQGPSSLPMAFVHGVPASTDIAAATCSTDFILLRKLLKAAVIPVPTGRALRLDQTGDLIRRASRDAFPMTIRPALGDRPNDVIANIRNRRELRRAIAYMQVPEADRPGHSKAAFELTLLPEPIEVRGKRMSPRQYRVLVEHQPEGQQVRVLVIDGVVESALLNQGPYETWAPRAVIDVTDQLHESLRTLAIRAAAAVPGLALATVDLVIEDLAVGEEDQDCYVTGITARPRLSAQACVSDAFSALMGEKIVRHHAQEVGLTLGSRHDIVDIRFTAFQASDATTTARSLEDAFRAFGLTGQIDAIDQQEGSIEGRVGGDPRAMALLLEQLTSGKHDSLHATYVDCRLEASPR